MTTGPANICWSFLMVDYSLVPVEHQPDFENVSLVPVDHDPFSADGVTQQAPGQQAQNEPISSMRNAAMISAQALRPRSD
ncbi:hypothetical protein G8O24_03180 [Bradyrhizobium sp. INPA01-394B]|uniref:Uncharacterized protein n=1 Tax=Bradyrhizobium campsiandrae TaxID=1729892 RepID=A0ABR7U9J2_9BRAD|nr:hypothetical protein [Bradyrhizobium campsiandrae]MBC9876348.1 hypothetical protein [Bradyrhizobium campsiandrae]MBC9980129.1 hypothetical protein [Bradyrhizobium campsiandrae]